MKYALRMWLRQHGAPIAVFLMVAALLLGTLPSIAENSRAEQLRIAEDTLRRAVVSCYALEGRYPPDIQYLRQAYGLQLNEEKYIVHYEIFAENIMPEITVLER